MLLLPCSLHHRCTMCYVSHCILCTIGVPVKGYVSLFINKCTMCNVSHCILCTIGVPVKGYVNLFICMFIPVYCMLLLPCFLHHRCAMCYVSHCILCTIGVPVKGYVSLFIHMSCMYINAAVAARSILYRRIGPPEVSLGSCPVGTRSGQHWKNLKIGKVSLIQILPCPPKYLSFKYHSVLYKFDLL